jgi:hypothetical protein
VAASARLTRRVIVLRSLAGAGVLLGAPLAVQAAQVEESDETAVALGYRHDTAKVDGKRFPKHAATQHCANCALYQGAAADAWGGCAMFGRKQVAGGGWCSAWVKK